MIMFGNIYHLSATAFFLLPLTVKCQIKSSMSFVYKLQTLAITENGYEDNRFY